MSKKSLLIDFNNIVLHNKLYNLINTISPIPPNSNYDTGLIITIPIEQYNLLKNISKGIQKVKYINTNSFVESIYQYIWILYDREKKIIELNTMNRIIDENIISSLLLNIPNDTTLWIRIPLDIENNSELIENYSKYGFKNPYICKKSPLGKNFETYGLCLCKINTISNIINPGESNYIINMFRKNSRNCTVQFNIPKNTIKFLKKLSYIGSTLNDNRTISQKEISGSFKIGKIVNKKLFTLKVNKKSLIYGKEEEVEIIDSLYNFHTHPYEAYINNNVIMGWPSAQDYLGFLSCVKVYSTIFHAVISIEGLYILSISNHWINLIHELNDNSIKFIKKKYKIQKNQNKDPSWYVNNINSILYKGFPIFSVKFFNWNDRVIFSVSFKNKGVNCFIKEETLSNYNYLYKHNE